MGSGWSWLAGGEEAVRAALRCLHSAVGKLERPACLLTASSTSCPQTCGFFCSHLSFAGGKPWGNRSPWERFGAEQKRFWCLRAETSGRLLLSPIRPGSRRKRWQVPPEGVWCRLCLASRILAWGWSPSWSNGPRSMHRVGWETRMGAAPTGLEGMSE